MSEDTPQCWIAQARSSKDHVHRRALKGQDSEFGGFDYWAESGELWLVDLSGQLIRHEPYVTATKEAQASTSETENPRTLH